MDCTIIPSVSLNHGSVKIPRLYQAELIEEAKKRNIIIRADTGTGKTLVALELIAWTAARTKADPAHHQIQAFLVPTRPLVHQQAEYIQSQSPGLRVKAYTGDLQPELWNIDKWRSELNGVDLIVSTAQIFYDLVSKGYWKFEDISLLIFDEAHHCRKNHVYNQIMRSHYHRLAQDPVVRRLPKILGLTASPIWDYKDLEKAENDIRSLQCALAAQIYEVKRHVEDVGKHNFKPSETAVYFEPSPAFQKLSHPPWEQINELLALHASPKVITAFESVCWELGTYAYYVAVFEWLKSLLNVGGSKQLMSGRLVDPSHQQKIQQVIEHVEKLVDIHDIPQDQLSPKVIALNKILVDYKEKEDHDNFLCIVFVERRQYAQLLSLLLERNALLKDFIRPAPLTGHGAGNEVDLIGIKMDSKTQNKTVAKFRTGEHNLTIATSVAEEGLDFRSCRVVIRFDLITTWKGYIQSRGRARARDSEYIVMLPTGFANKYLAFSGKEEELKAALYDRPEDELIEDGEIESTPQLICRLADGKDSILTYSAATSLLNDVCQLIPADEFLPLVAPEYEMTCLAESFRCQVTLPPMAALPPSQRRFTGLEMPTKRDAKRSAAFEACKFLRELGVLNEHFLPQREDKTAQICDADGREVENTPLSEQVEAIVPNVYGDFRTSAEIWLHQLSFPDENSTSFSTIGFLCGRHLSVPDGLKLFDHFPGTRSLPVKIERSQLIAWDKDESSINLERLETFTRMVMQAAINRKQYDGKLYFLVAPLLQGRCEIDWNLMNTSLTPLSSIADIARYSCIIVPMRQLSHRIYETCESSGGLSDTSPPHVVPFSPSMRDFCKKISKFHTLGHFYKVVYEMKEEQFKGELVYLETTFQACNNLSRSESSSAQPYRILLPLKLCKGTHISRSLWKVFSYLPSLTRLIHDALQATALMKRLESPTIPILLAIEALTPPGVGAPWDYQTLETVGDAFLKLATTVHVYLTHLKKGEGDMSRVRSKSVDNAYLRRKALQANLPGSILSQRFRTDRFRDTQTEDGKELANGDFSRKIPRRVLSDVVEALLGAGFLTGGIALGLKIGTALDLCFGGTSPWSERELNVRFGTAAAQCTLQQPDLIKCEALEKKIGYVFNKQLLLIQALTHRSANSFMTNCYEREEWLGDAVIDMWIVDHAYKRFENPTAEELTLARAKVVSNGSLGFLAIKKLNLHEIIMHKSETFQQACAEAIEAIEPFTTIEEFFSNINNLFAVFDPPKILNDVLEAIVGAVFIDSGFNLQTVYRTLDTIFEEVTPGMSQLVARDPLSTMLRLRDRYQCAELRRISTIINEPNPEGEDKKPSSVKVCRIELHGQEIAVGQHKSSASVAEQRAALEAIKVLGEDDESTRTLTKESPWSRCQCKDIAAAAMASSTTTKSKKKKKKIKAAVTLVKISQGVVGKSTLIPTQAMKVKKPKKLDEGTGSKIESVSDDDEADNEDQGCMKNDETVETASNPEYCEILEVGETDVKSDEDGLMVEVAENDIVVIEKVLVEEEEEEEEVEDELSDGKKNKEKRLKRNRQSCVTEARLESDVESSHDDQIKAAYPVQARGQKDSCEGRVDQPIVIEDEDELSDHNRDMIEPATSSRVQQKKPAMSPSSSRQPLRDHKPQIILPAITALQSSTCTRAHPSTPRNLAEQPARKKSKNSACPSSSSSSK